MLCRKRDILDLPKDLASAGDEPVRRPYGEGEPVRARECRDRAEWVELDRYDLLMKALADER
ncbi:MAG TPA: hypothetical protein VFD82_05340 [Planctomycetota bacterium]|nr:hypothetical protein [Planctomycetota bacterium]